MSLARKQQIYLDGVEESFKFIRIAYSRILKSIRSQDPLDDKVDERSDALILDSWTIVDLAKRMRTLLEQMPGLKQTPDLRLFLNRTEDVPTFRHYIQHLETEATDVSLPAADQFGDLSRGFVYFPTTGS
jgi:hypothetical protein